MTPDELIAVYKTETKAATALGLTKECINKWKHQGYIPNWSQWAIQAKSKGKLKAEVLVK